MIRDLVTLLAAPFAATLVLLGIHAWFGLHILRRNVIFTDLALAQSSSFGATLALALGHAPGDTGSFAYSLVFAFAGAALLTASRTIGRSVSQEALIGILYVVATAATVLVIDRAPQGAEHVKRMLVGNLLSVGPANLREIVPLYAAVALLHVLARRPLLRVSESAASMPNAALWDFVFYASFGVVVTSSVAIAGVLLVFSLLIIPAVIGMLFARDMVAALLVGWAAGLLAATGGFAVSVAFDLPTGAMLVLALATALILAGIARALFCGAPLARKRNRRRDWRFVTGAVLAAVFAGGIWSLLQPAADQPLLAALAPMGIRPERFLHPVEAMQFTDAQRNEQQQRRMVDSLAAQERRSRWNGKPLSDEEVWRVASYQQTYNEMSQGDRFVQQFLLARARQRERWLVSLPLSMLSGLCLLALLRPRRLWRRVAPRSWRSIRQLFSAC